MQASSNLVAVRRRQKPILEVICVYDKMGGLMHILGVHLDSPHLRAALIYKGRKGIEIRNLSDVKPLYIRQFRGRIATGIPTKDFLIRPMELKINGNRHIEEAIAFQSEAVNHFDPAEILSVPLVQKKEKGNIEALLFTVPREALKKHLESLEKLQIDPDGVSTIPLALTHFIRWKFPQLLDPFIIDLGSSEISCVLMENGRLKKAHSIGIGVEHLLSSLLEDRKKLLRKEIEGAAKQLDLLLLKPGLNPHLSASLNKLRGEIAKTFYSFCREGKREVIFTGRSDAFIHFREFIMEAGNWPLTLEEQKFAVAIGLGLEQTSSHPLQLRREEFFPQKNWRRMGAYALTLLTSSLLLSALFLGFGIRSSHLRKTDMFRSLHVSNEEQIDSWISSIEKNNKEYPYILQAPKATEVLAWISSHPLLEELRKEGDPIDIRQIRYQLQSYPTIDAPKAPYLAKVEIEFQFKSGMNARRFHEALRKGDAQVNPKLEIGWDASNDGYRASFFLNNRSPYVP